MQEIVQYLINNPDVLNKLSEGTVSLLGVSAEQLKAILQVFFDGQVTPKAYYWV